MDDDRLSADPIEAMVAPWRHLTDQQLLDHLAALPVLPDEDDPAWDDERTWLDHADPYMALAELAAERQLRPAMLLLLERACYGDPGEIMRALRHPLERIATPDWDLLTDACLQAAERRHRGARLWAISELAVLSDSRALDTLIRASDDPAPLVRDAAVGALESLSVAAPAWQPAALAALRGMVLTETDPDVLRRCRAAIAGLEDMEEP